MFGALGGVLPLRLGGTATNGWTAAQHARFVADLVAVNRTVPLARMTIVKSGAAVAVDYSGRNGTGFAHAPNEIGTPGTGAITLRWTNQSFLDTYGTGKLEPVSIRAIVASRGDATGGKMTAIIEGSPALLWLRNWNSAGTLQDGTFIVRIWGTVGDSATRAIGDYAGEPDKYDSPTEGNAPYAEYILREFQAQRGSAYSQKRGSLVDCENLALARFWAAVGPRNAEKLRANAHPGTSDERLPYWEKLLGLPFAANEPKWSKRKKLAAHYPPSEGPKLDVLRGRLSALLGEVFVDLVVTGGTDLDHPPALTYWPGVNPGPAEYSLGGGCWASERDHYFVEVQQPSGMSDGDFLQLANVQLFALLDDLLPATATFSWGIGGGFFLDISRLDFTGLTPS